MGNFDKSGLTVTRVVEILRVRHATLSDVTNGRASVSAEMALRPEKAFGVSMNEIAGRLGFGSGPLQGDKIKVERFKPDHARL